MMRLIATLVFSVSIALGSCASLHGVYQNGGTLNDIHSKLNETEVERITQPQDEQDIADAIRFAKSQGLKVSISGGKHSMGGQQFGTGNLHMDMSAFNQIHSLNSTSGIVEVDSGVQWPELIEWLHNNQEGEEYPWVIRQKQTGADRFSIGGSLSSNIHGRGLIWQPFVQDIESFTLIAADGEVYNCSRTENQELFSLVIGGYGLFGVITKVNLRLMRQTRLVRHVELIGADEIDSKVNSRIENGYLFGDFQFSTDPASDNFLQKGVFSFYKPVPTEKSPKPPQKRLGEREWLQLVMLGHTDKARAYELYSSYYLGTNDQRYWSDSHQLSTYLDDYHSIVDQQLGAEVTGSEMISEVYVPSERIEEFLAEAAELFRSNKVNVIYGTVRFIKQDDVTFLPWAKQDYASIVINIHVDHSDDGIEKVKQDFRDLFDLSLSYGGNFFLTYHRWATKEQILEGYPQFPVFLRLKLKYDPDELFASDWYRHYREMFAAEL
ncbi:MAG: FAD-binding oxidoreductase [Bdellovibrionales bacterium]|nr:FAD-binding oxidoreductase [Bdellovibrionales bacterium]